MRTKLARRRYLIVSGVALVLVGAALGTFLVLSRGTRGMPSPPPYINVTSTYPDVIATVNGEPIPGVALAQLDAVAEEVAKTPPSPGWPQMQGDPLDCVINQYLLRQAADRLGLEPTRAEVEEYAREYEEDLKKLPPDKRLEFESLMIAQGFPTENFTADERAMAAFKGIVKRLKLRDYIKEQVAREQGIPVDQVQGGDLRQAEKALLAAERANAEIVILIPRPTPTPLPTVRLPTPRTPISPPTTATDCW